VWEIRWGGNCAGVTDGFQASKIWTTGQGRARMSGRRLIVSGNIRKSLRPSNASQKRVLNLRDWMCTFTGVWFMEVRLCN
jgi:hypothetical protein